MMKRFIGVVIVFAAFFLFCNVYAADAEQLYNNFINSISVYEEYNGRVSLPRADAITVSTNMLTDPDNKETVKSLLNEVVNKGGGTYYTALRNYIGIDSEGKFNADTGATALYTVAKMIDAENAYFTNSDGYENADGYVKNYFQYGMSGETNGDETFKLYGYQSDGTSQDSITYGHITSINGAALDDFSKYYEEYVKDNFENGRTTGHTIVNRDYSIANSEYKIEAGTDTTIVATPGTDTTLTVAERIDDLSKTRENTTVTDNFKNIEGEKPSEYVQSHTPDNVVGKFAASFDINKILKDASKFFGSSLKAKEGGIINIKGLTDGIIRALFQIGNLIILTALVFMGIRYIFSSVSGKAEIKESLINMSAGIIFFYVAQGVYDFGRDILVNLIADTTNIADLTTSIWGNVATVVKVLSLIGMAAVGLRYMFSNAEGKLNVKKQLLPLVIGLVLIYCATSFTQFIIDASSEALGEDISHSDVEVINEGNANSSVTLLAGKVYTTGALIIQILAIAAMVLTGLRYMFANADMKANIKKQCIVLFLGAAIIFGGIEIIKALKIIGDDVLDTSYIIERKL